MTDVTLAASKLVPPPKSRTPTKPEEAGTGRRIGAKLALKAAATADTLDRKRKLGTRTVKTRGEHTQPIGTRARTHPEVNKAGQGCAR